MKVNNDQELNKKLNMEHSDVLGIDDIVVNVSIWKLTAYAMGYALFISILITIGIQAIFKTPIIELIQIFSTVIFFVGGIYIFGGAATDMSEYSPFIRHLTFKKDMSRNDYNLKKGRSRYITGIVLVLCSFVIVILEIHQILP